MNFKATDQVKVGALELLVDISPDRYGSNTVEYFDRLAKLRDQQMPYQRLLEEHLKSFKTDESGKREIWNIGFYVNDSSELMFKAIFTRFMGSRYGYGSIMNHKSNHDVAKLNLEKI